MAIPAFSVTPNSANPTTFAADMDNWLSQVNAWAAAANDLAAQMGISGTLGANVGNFLLAASSANLRAAMTDETGTGLLVFNDGATLLNTIFTNYTETTYAPSAGTSFTVNLANGTMQKFTTSGNCSIALPTPAPGKSYVIRVAYGGAHTLAFTGGGVVKWPSNITPPATSVNGKFDTFLFTSDDATNTFGYLMGANS